LCAIDISKKIGQISLISIVIFFEPWTSPPLDQKDAAVDSPKAQRTLQLLVPLVVHTKMVHLPRNATYKVGCDIYVPLRDHLHMLNVAATIEGTSPSSGVSPSPLVGTPVVGQAPLPAAEISKRQSS
jgi:hypothetical protein